MLLGTLISCTALSAGLKPVRVGRYSAIVPGPSPAQADPFALPVSTEFPYSVHTVGAALEQVLAPSGYRLASLTASCPSLPTLLAWPLPAVHQALGPMRLDEALKTLAGPAHTLVVDPVHRLVSFELRAPYDGLVQAGTPTAPLPAATTMVPAAIETAPETEPLAFEPRPALAPIRSEPEPTPSTEGSPVKHRIGPIAPGTQLWPIASELREAFNAPIEQVMVGLFKTNPESFCYRNLHCLKVGAYLDPRRQPAWPQPRLWKHAVPCSVILEHGARATAVWRPSLEPREKR
jgi:conjugative transfer region protein (TIGR03748 family)